MAELYKGQAGSPITYLAADISAAQTTISIADDSALPPAPNIATIGYGEQLETIKYGVKNNGILQDVTRGIEGTARAWQKGIEVARYFTAYDHQAILEQFNELNGNLSEIVKKANKQQEPWKTQTLLNGWVEVYTIGYRKNEFGGIELKGLIGSGITDNNTSLFVLPIGYRPTTNRRFITGGYSPNIGSAILNISSAGNVTLFNKSVSNITYICLDNINIAL